MSVGFVDPSVGWSVGFGWSVHRSVGLSIGRSVGRSVLVGGPSAGQSFHRVVDRPNSNQK